MKIKAKELYLSVNAIEILANNKLPIQAAYEVSLVVDEVMRMHGIIEAHRESIIKKFGKHNKKENVYAIPEDDVIALSNASTEFEMYLSEDVELNIDKISIGILGDINISINDIKKLGWLLTK